MTIELGLAVKAFNLVTKFEKNRLTFVAVIARKRSVTDRQTDGQTQINNPPFFFEKAGDNTLCKRCMMIMTYALYTVVSLTLDGFCYNRI